MVFAINYYDLSMDYTYPKKRKILVWIMAFIICLEMSKTLNFIWDFEFEKQKLKNVEIFWGVFTFSSYPAFLVELLEDGVTIVSAVNGNWC